MSSFEDEMFENKMVDMYNREHAMKQAKMVKAKSNLEKAKAESKFWSSRRGVARKLPEAMLDTLKRTLKIGRK